MNHPYKISDMFTCKSCGQKIDGFVYPQLKRLYSEEHHCSDEPLSSVRVDTKLTDEELLLVVCKIDNYDSIKEQILNEQAKA